MSTVHIGEGRFLDHTEGALFPPPPPPKKRRGFPKHEVPTESYYKPSQKRPNRKAPFRKYSESIPGYKEYMSFWLTLSLRYSTPWDRLGTTHRVNRTQRNELIAIAKRQAKEDMSKIKKTIEMSDVAEEALEGALTVLRSPSSQQTKLAAAKLILEFTKSKPVAKSEVSVNKAEEWLASLGHDE